MEPSSQEEQEILNPLEQAADENGILWIFGYGSLVWRPSFPHVQCHWARLDGLRFKRRFWQGSPDHRGTPQNLGRVITLVERHVDGERDVHLRLQPTDSDDDQAIWGKVYGIASDQQDEVLQYLDHREKGGYVRDVIQVMVENENHHVQRINVSTI